jgi:hypothetical protein
VLKGVYYIGVIVERAENVGITAFRGVVGVREMREIVG